MAPAARSKSSRNVAFPTDDMQDEDSSEFWQAGLHESYAYDDSSTLTIGTNARRRGSHAEAAAIVRAQVIERDSNDSNEAIARIKKKYVSEKLLKREASFQEKPLMAKICCCTFNVNGKKDVDGDLGPWLEVVDPSGNPVDPHIYAIGFQEIVDLNAVNVAVSDSKTQQRTAMWKSQVDAYFGARADRGDGHPYEFLEQKTLVGVALLVYIRRDCASSEFIKNIQQGTASTGFRGYGNKGGVSISFQFHGSTLCFVCSHLAAHRGSVDRRNADFFSIIGKTVFRGENEKEWEFRGLDNKELIRDGSNGFGQLYGILDHDLVFWMGDLNYRIDETVSTEEVFERLQEPLVNTEKGMPLLRKRDQLNLERAKNGPEGAFGEFEEEELRFLPTYKYEVGTSRYDQRPDKKVRPPAWCDRVLWRSQEQGHVRCLEYRRAELLLSDHKPVAALLEAKIRIYDKVAHEKAFDAVLDDLRQYERTTQRPQITLSSQQVDLGEVHFKQSKTGQLRVTNVGQALAYIRFTPPIAGAAAWPSWLKVDPPFALLRPGKDITLKLTAEVGDEMAQALAAGRAVLEDNIVLRLERGPEYYINVFGAYARSAFGASLQSLVVRGAAGGGGEEIAALGLPVEIWRLVDGIVRRGGHNNIEVAEELFVATGDSDEVATIRECVDTGALFPDECSAHSLLKVLKLLLQALPELLVSVEKLKQVERQQARGPEQYLNMLQLMPAVHQNSFLYFVSFLRGVYNTRLSAASRLSTRDAEAAASSLSRQAAQAMLPEHHGSVSGTAEGGGGGDEGDDEDGGGGEERDTQFNPVTALKDMVQEFLMAGS